MKNLKIGKFKKGKLNLITDVDGVLVGHSTINNEMAQTGVTCIIPSKGDIFREKLSAGVSIINGYSKSVGIMQVKELGNIETPIFLTNTMSVGEVLRASTKYMIKKYKHLGDKNAAPNLLVFECNDGVINDMRGLHVKEENVIEAISNSKEEFTQGSVGAGTGMVSFNLKSGIGSSSRIINIEDKTYTIGSLVLSNFGSIKNLKINGRNIGNEMYMKSKEHKENKDKGSIIIIIATDIPLDSRQLTRVAKRSTISLANVGSNLGNGSGDIALAFSTANKIFVGNTFDNIKMLNEDLIDKVFDAAIELVEESIINSLIYSETTVTKDGKKIYSLKDNMKKFDIK